MAHGLAPDDVGSLESRLRDLEQFIYGAPELVDATWWQRSPVASVAAPTFSIVRVNRIRGRQVLLSWLIQGSNGDLFALPASLWPAARLSGGGTMSVPVAGTAASYTSAHVLSATQNGGYVWDYRSTSIGAWVIPYVGGGGTGISMGHIIYGLER